MVLCNFCLPNSMESIPLPNGSLLAVIVFNIIVIKIKIHKLRHGSYKFSY